MTTWLSDADKAILASLKSEDLLNVRPDHVAMFVENGNVLFRRRRSRAGQMPRHAF